MHVLLQRHDMQTPLCPCCESALTIGMMVDGKVAWVASSTTTTLNCLVLTGCFCLPAPVLLGSVKTRSPTDEQVPATTCRTNIWGSQGTAEVVGLRLCLTQQGVSCPSRVPLAKIGSAVTCFSRHSLLCRLTRKQAPAKQRVLLRSPLLNLFQLPLCPNLKLPSFLLTMKHYTMLREASLTISTVSIAT